MAEKKKRQLGRKTWCTPELTKEIGQVLQAGNYIEAACAYAGITTSCYYNWIRKGEDELERLVDLQEEEGLEELPAPSERAAPYVNFVDVTTRARGAAEVTAVTLLATQQALGNMQAIQFFLERSFPTRWGRKKVEVEHKGEIKLKLKFNVPDPRGGPDGE